MRHQLVFFSFLMSLSLSSSTQTHLRDPPQRGIVSYSTPATGSREELVQRLLAGVDEGHDLAASIGMGVVDVVVAVGLLLSCCCSCCCSCVAAAADAALTSRTASVRASRHL